MDDPATNGADQSVARRVGDRKRKKKSKGKRALKLVDGCLNISSEEEASNKVTLAKKLCLGHLENGQRRAIDRLDKLGMSPQEKWNVAKWLGKGIKKMEGITYHLSKRQ